MKPCVFCGATSRVRTKKHVIPRWARDGLDIQGWVTMHGRDRAGSPSPYRVREAVGLLGAETGKCAFICDSPNDVPAGHLAGVPVIGYANKPAKAEALTRVQAATVTTSLTEITTALRAAPVTALPNWGKRRDKPAWRRRWKSSTPKE